MFTYYSTALGYSKETYVQRNKMLNVPDLGSLSFGYLMPLIPNFFSAPSDQLNEFQLP